MSEILRNFAAVMIIKFKFRKLHLLGVLSPLCYESVSFVAERKDNRAAVAK